MGERYEEEGEGAGEVEGEEGEESECSAFFLSNTSARIDGSGREGRSNERREGT